MFRKDLTRFAPLWGVYILCLILGMFLLMDGDLAFRFAANMGTLTNAMAVINLGYALIVAQVLFGDLFNSRMCNALHAMPMRRESLFVTHTAAGLVFSLLPTAILAAAAMPFILAASNMVDGWQIPLYCFLGTNLQYLFFFGLAAVSMFCAGNRVSAALIYVIANFLSYLVYLLVDTVYTPMLHGVITQSDIFTLLCPVVYLVSDVSIESKRNREFVRYSTTGDKQYDYYGTFTLVSEQWIYMGVIALVGAALLGLSLWLYRRRRLECAGDFMASRKLEPVFMVLFSVVTACVFQLVSTALVGYKDDLSYLFLFAGLAAGWFAGRMLIERQTQVFRRGRNWLGFAALALALGASLLVTKLDPLGIEDRVPQAEDVKSATISTGYRGELTTEDSREIEDILTIHRLALTYKLTDDEVSEEEAKAYKEVEYTDPYTGEVVTTSQRTEDYRKYTYLTITYRLRSGRTMERDYIIWLDTEEGDLCRTFFSRPKAIFCDYNLDMNIEDGQDLLNMAGTPDRWSMDTYALPEELLTEEMAESFLRAFLADCEAGTTVQRNDFHEGNVLEEGENCYRKYYCVFLRFGDEAIDLDIYADCENTLAWLEEHGVRQMVDAELLEDWEELG